MKLEMKLFRLSENDFANNHLQISVFNNLMETEHIYALTHKVDFSSNFRITTNLETTLQKLV